MNGKLWDVQSLGNSVKCVPKVQEESDSESDEVQGCTSTLKCYPGTPCTRKEPERAGIPTRYPGYFLPGYPSRNS
eukprot:3876545-Rhodomonas_salina.1